MPDSDDDDVTKPSPAQRLPRRLDHDRTRPSWTTAPEGPVERAQRYQGVIKELGTDAWLWQCKHEHETRAAAIDCARVAQT